MKLFRPKRLEEPRSRGLNRRADGAQNLADRAAQEELGDERDDRDESEDQRVFGEALAVLVVAAKRGENPADDGHGPSPPENGFHHGSGGLRTISPRHRFRE